MKPVDDYKYKGYTIEVYPDDNPLNPRTEFSNLSVMALFHKRYRLGDRDHGFRWEDYGGWDEMEEAIRARVKPAVLLPVYMYDHSGITIRTTLFSCPWDSGQIGFAWITEKAARENWGWKHLTELRRTRVEEGLKQEVAVYDSYLTGSVYGYVIKDPDGNELDDGSCWGWYGTDAEGEDSPMVEQAKHSVDCEIERREKAERSRNENNPAQLKLGMEGVA